MAVNLLPPVEFEISTDDADFLCTDEMITDLLTEVEDFPNSLLDTPDKLAELKVLARSRLEQLTGKHIIWRDWANELHDGNEKFTLTPQHTPILSVSEVTITRGGQVLTLVEDEDFWIYKDHLEFKRYLWGGHKNVSLTYRSGIGPVVSLSSARAIAMMAARHIIIDLSSGAGESSAITAGPVSLKESFSPNGEFAAKLSKMSQSLNEWILAKAGVRMQAVGKRRFSGSIHREFVPRLDAIIDFPDG